MMKTITAPNVLENLDCIKVFLGGGIQKCPDWQSKIINDMMRMKWDDVNVTLINPRQPNFDMNDSHAAEKQITWEFNNLNAMDMFTMFFYGPTESDQPICFYELGRYIEVIRRRFPDDWENRIVITVCKDFRRYEDVLVQTRLATEDKVVPYCVKGYNDALLMHELAIVNALKNIKQI